MRGTLWTCAGGRIGAGSQTSGIARTDGAIQGDYALSISREKWPRSLNFRAIITYG